MAGLKNIHLNMYVIQFCVAIVCHIAKQIVKAPGLLVKVFLKASKITLSLL